MDVREMFHNYMMHPSERMYHGLNIDDPGLLGDPELKGLVGAMMWFCWLDFGWRRSPYFACRMMMRAVELTKGDRANQLSAYAWCRVKLNLPLTMGYDPVKLWVAKIWLDCLGASEVLFFVDNGRIIGATEMLARLVMRQLAVSLQWKGIQNAARKRRCETM
jgi:hypothetical protein